MIYSFLKVRSNLIQWHEREGQEMQVWPADKNPLSFIVNTLESLEWTNRLIPTRFIKSGPCKPFRKFQRTWKRVFVLKNLCVPLLCLHKTLGYLLRTLRFFGVFNTLPNLLLEHIIELDFNSITKFCANTLKC
jgi:hypothetical protein